MAVLGCKRTRVYAILIILTLNKIFEYACEFVAKFGYLDCLKYLHETAKWPWNYLAVREAHKKNQTDCVQYLLDNNCPLPPGWLYEDRELYSEIETESELESESESE